MRKENAFTLAETMIVIVVLGIIATLTIPALVNKNKESVAKTKVRKAMAAYESALNKMIIENDLKDNGPLTAWAGANCANSTNYFKKVQGDGCIFKTLDGIWWNITDIERPVISFKEINNDNIDTITTNANNANDKTAFVLVGRFGKDGSLRIDDLAYETANDTANSKAQVEKLYNLLSMKSTGAGGGNQSPFAACNGADTCVVGGITYTKMTLTARTETYDYCDPKDYYYHVDEKEEWYTCGEDDDKWKTGTSESEAGDIYVAIEDNTSDYDTAKRYCESSGGSLATIAQLRSLQSQGKFPYNSYFWAYEVYDMNNAFVVDYQGGGDWDTKDHNRRILCVGN